MEQQIIIRNETSADHKLVEEITRKSFYNLYIPGCVEHYLVHVIRDHEDFIPELDFVLELDGNVIGNIMYTKSKLTDENGKYPAAMMVKELIPNVLKEHRWIYQHSPVMAINEKEAMNYDDSLEKMEKKYQPSQDEFYIMSHSFIEENGGNEQI